MNRTIKDSIKSYIEYKKTNNNTYPNFEDYIIWYEETNNRTIKKENNQGVRGLIYIYSKQWLNERISTGARNTRYLVSLLKALIEENQQINSQEEQIQTEPIKITIPKKIKLNNE